MIDWYLMALSFLIGFFSYFAYIFSKGIYISLKYKANVSKKLREKKKEVEKMKEGGDHHEWIEMPVGYQNRHVCKKTGYCPDLDDFIPMSSVELHLSKLETEKKWKDYKEEKLSKMASEYKIDFCDMEEIAEEIYKMKQMFSVQQMKEYLESVDMKDIKIVTMEELSKELDNK